MLHKPEQAKKLLNERQIEQIRAYIVRHVKSDTTNPFAGESAKERIMSIIRDALQSGYVDGITPSQISDNLIRYAYSKTVGLGPLEELLSTPDIVEINVLSPDAIAYRKSDGSLYYHSGCFENEDHLYRISRILAERIGYSLSDNRPILDVRVPIYNARVQINAFGVYGPTIAIRRGRQEAFTFYDYVRNGTMSQPMSDLLQTILAAPYSILIIGEPGSGKTTLLETFISEISKLPEIIAVVENTQELYINSKSNVHHLAQDKIPSSNINERDLLLSIMRINAGILVHGELRFPRETSAFVTVAMGMKAAYATFHATSVESAIGRLVMLLSTQEGELGAIPANEIKREVARLFPFAILLEKLPDGKHIVKEITAIVNGKNDITLKPLYKAYARLQGDKYVVRWRVNNKNMNSIAPLLKAARARQQYQSLVEASSIVTSDVKRAEHHVSNSRFEEAYQAIKEAFKHPHLVANLLHQTEILNMMENILEKTGRWEQVRQKGKQVVSEIYSLLQNAECEKAQEKYHQAIEDIELICYIRYYSNDIEDKIAECKKVSQQIETLIAQIERFIEVGDTARAEQTLNNISLPRIPQKYAQKITQLRSKIKK